LSDFGVVPVKSYSSRIEAELAKAVLESNGVPAMISDDDVSDLETWIRLGVRVLANQEDAPRASIARRATSAVL
jgi:hypothetical protein